MANWDYGNFAEKYDMNGEIHVGTGILKVHDIFNPLPEFMKKADVIFSDPPCSLSNINSFYTKADKEDEKKADYAPFYRRFFECIDEIKPKKLFLEVFKSNKKSFLEACKERYPIVKEYQTTYYHKPECKCWFIVCELEDGGEYPFEGMDEEEGVEWICANVNYDCIGDLCMGQGLVGKEAFKNGKKFVGTELNVKRLAVLVDKINTNRLGKL